MHSRRATDSRGRHRGPKTTRRTRQCSFTGAHLLPNPPPTTAAAPLPEENVDAMTSETEERPAKRARSSSIPSSDNRTLEHDAALWFDDGNIILACGSTGFRVHASVLSLNCHVFKDMLASGTPSAGEVHEGVDLVRLSDDPADMRLLLTPMYYFEYVA